MCTKVIIVFLIICSSLMASDNDLTTLSGFVYDSSDVEALIGANVYLANTIVGSSRLLSIPVSDSTSFYYRQLDSIK